jgi:hypothetical protein
VPIVAEVFKKAGTYDPRRLFGVTTLDVVRAARFLSEITDGNPKDTVVTVVGGHSGATIVPLLSQTSHGKGVAGESYEKIVHRIQFGGDEVVKAKDGAGSATLSMAYAGAKFANAVLRGLGGEKGVITPTFVESPLFADQGVEYFSSLVELGVRLSFSLLHRIGFDHARVGQWCGEDPPYRRAVGRGGEAPRGVPARPQEEHREGRQLRQPVRLSTGWAIDILVVDGAQICDKISHGQGLGIRLRAFSYAWCERGEVGLLCVGASAELENNAPT